MNFHLLELKFVTEKDAESSCREIAGAIPRQVIENTTSFLGDSNVTQRKTQRLLADHFKIITGKNDHLPQFFCLMHLGGSTYLSTFP